MARTRRQVKVKLYAPKQEERSEFQRRVNEVYADAVTQRLKYFKLDRKARQEVLHEMAERLSRKM